MRQPAIERQKRQQRQWLYGGMVCSLCVHKKIGLLGEKGILQCVTKWMTTNTVPITIWGVPEWKGGGRRKFSHLETLCNHKVFVSI